MATLPPYGIHFHSFENGTQCHDEQCGKARYRRYVDGGVGVGLGETYKAMLGGRRKETGGGGEDDGGGLWRRGRDKKHSSIG